MSDRNILQKPQNPVKTMKSEAKFEYRSEAYR
jgi:hypothetical protein